MKLQTIVDRIVDKCPGIVTAELITDIRRLEEVDVETPYAGVMWSQDTSEPQSGAGRLVRHARRRSFTVVIIGEAPNDDREPVEDARAELFNALIGWQPDGESYRIEYDGGQNANVQAGVMRWLETYAYTDYLRYVR